MPMHLIIITRPTSKPVKTSRAVQQVDSFPCRRLRLTGKVWGETIQPAAVPAPSLDCACTHATPPQDTWRGVHQRIRFARQATHENAPNIGSTVS